MRADRESTGGAGAGGAMDGGGGTGILGDGVGGGGIQGGGGGGGGGVGWVEGGGGALGGKVLIGGGGGGWVGTTAVWEALPWFLTLVGTGGARSVFTASMPPCSSINW